MVIPTWVASDLDTRHGPLELSPAGMARSLGTPGARRVRMRVRGRFHCFLSLGVLRCLLHETLITGVLGPAYAVA